MLDLEFIQKIVFQTGEVSTNGLMLPIPQLIFYFMILVSIYFILLGEKKERIMAYIIMVALGFFYVGDATLQLAYGVESVTNAFYTPIVKMPLDLVTLILYVLFTLLSVAGLRKLQQHSRSKSL